MEFNQSTNEEIMNAIQGVSPPDPATTLSTGLASSNMPAAPNPLDANSVYSDTTKNMFGGANANPFTNTLNMSSRQHSPGVGRDQWSSQMGLDSSAILRSLGLGSA